MRQICFYFFISLLGFTYLNIGVAKSTNSFQIKSNVVDTAKFKCTYKFKFLIDSTKMTFKDNDLYVIQIGDNFTKSYCYQLFYFDSIYNAKGKLDVSPMMDYYNKNKPVDGSFSSDFLEGLYKFTNGFFSFYVYKDYIKEKVTVTDYISYHKFIYDDELKPQDWIVMEDTMSVLGYLCQKAVCSFRGRDWEAWFTPDIPVSEGPYKFYGLPGLIMKLEDNESHYIFEIQGIEQINEPIYMTANNSYRKIDRLTFLKLRMNRTGTDLAAMDLAKVGINANSVYHYDHIERDYK